METRKQRRGAQNEDKDKYTEYLNGEDPDGFERRFINEEIGWGVFTTKEFLKGQFLLEYKGEIMTEEEAEKRDYDSYHCYQYMYTWSGKKMCIDATTTLEHMARYVNDSPPSRRACNAKMKIIVNNNSVHLCLFSIRKIAVNEEIRYDYGVQGLEWRKKKTHGHDQTTMMTDTSRDNDHCHTFPGNGQSAKNTKTAVGADDVQTTGSSSTLTSIHGGKRSGDGEIAIDTDASITTLTSVHGDKSSDNCQIEIDTDVGSSSTLTSVNGGKRNGDCEIPIGTTTFTSVHGDKSSDNCQIAIDTDTGSSSTLTSVNGGKRSGDCEIAIDTDAGSTTLTSVHGDKRADDCQIANDTDTGSSSTLTSIHGDKRAGDCEIAIGTDAGRITLMSVHGDKSSDDCQIAIGTDTGTSSTSTSIHGDKRAVDREIAIDTDGSSSTLASVRGDKRAGDCEIAIDTDTGNSKRNSRTQLPNSYKYTLRSRQKIKIQYDDRGGSDSSSGDDDDDHDGRDRSSDDDYRGGSDSSSVDEYDDDDYGGPDSSCDDGDDNHGGHDGGLGGTSVHKGFGTDAGSSSTLMSANGGNRPGDCQIAIGTDAGSSSTFTSVHGDKSASDCEIAIGTDAGSTTVTSVHGDKRADDDIRGGHDGGHGATSVHKRTANTSCTCGQRAAIVANDQRETAGGGISVLQTNNSEQRKWDKGAYCPFCKTLQKKLPRHLHDYKGHQHEIPVIQWKATTDKTLKAKRLTKMRNHGNYLHNMEVIEKGEGIIIPVYRPNYPADYNNYLPCKDCLGFFAKGDLWKHDCKFREVLQLCDENGKPKKKRGDFVKASKLLLPSKGMTEIGHKILSGLRNDDDGVARFIKSDRLMGQLTEKYALKLGHDKGQFGHVRNKLREIGRMVLEYRAITNELNASLTDIIDPTKFSDVLQATRRTAGFNESTHLYRTPSLALKIGHELRKVTDILLGEALMTGDEATENKCYRFRDLLTMKWIDNVSSHALRTLQENKRNNPHLLPVTGDIAKFSSYLKTKVEEGKQNLVLYPNLSEHWKALAEVTLASILVFNRKRSGEISKMKLQDLDKCKQGAKNVDIFGDSLSRWEKELCKVLSHCEIVGKKGRTVPVLLSEKNMESLNLLKDKRRDAGVPYDNEYVFPLMNSTGHIRGCDVIRKHASLCGASKPEILRSTSLRKHIGTVSQVMNLKENELDLLARFLGHDIRVHREFYRLPDQTLHLAKVSKVLLRMESGNLSNLAGKGLDDIVLQEDEGEIYRKLFKL